MARFLQLTDIHAMPEGTLASGVLDTRRILETAIDRLVEMRPALDPLDALLVTGDISDDGSAESYGFAKAQLERLGLPLLVVPGNHDARDPMREAFSDLDIMPQSGLIDWAVTVGDTKVIGLDTLVEGQGAGVLRRESLDFLTREIANNGGPALVLLHHPPISTGIKFMDAIGLQNADELEHALFGALGDITLLSGHVHGTHFGRLGRHNVITGPSICSAFTLDRRENATVGFYDRPTACAVIEKGERPLWSTVPLGCAGGPYPF